VNQKIPKSQRTSIDRFYPEKDQNRTIKKKSEPSMSPQKPGKSQAREGRTMIVHLRQTPESSATATAWRYWSALSDHDRARYADLGARLKRSPRDVHDRRGICLERELRAVLEFVDSESAGFETRSVLAGIAFAGRYLAINTRQLSQLLGRCKSSINGSLQDLGYSAVESRAQVRNCVVQLLPSMANEPQSIKQWSVRVPSVDARCSFVARYGKILDDVSESVTTDWERSSEPVVDEDWNLEDLAVHGFGDIDNIF
jgi:hypothetical protein